MSAYGKVIWSDGLFLRPQHFQQQDRYFERYVETRCQALAPHSWGFMEVELERDFLSIGRIGLRRAAGVFPDGTPFRMPEDSPLPPPIELVGDVRDQIVHLALPLRRLGAQEADRAAASDDLTRQHVCELEARDGTSPSAEVALLEVGTVRTRLLLERDVTGAYACLPLAHVAEVRSDRQIVLDDSFIPTVLDARATDRLATLMTELLGLVHQRADALAGGIVTTDRGSTAEIADVLWLQALNRLEPLLAHHADGGALHPEQLFRLCVSIAGEMATFTTPRKRSPQFAPYRHERLRESFQPVVAALREAFSFERQRRVIPIPIEPKQHGLHVAMVPDRTLYSSAAFFLAARADVPPDELRQRLPAQLKVAPVEKIRHLVNLSLQGVPMQAMPAVPRQLPLHAGFVYFEFDQSHELWKQLNASGGIGIFVGEFPGLALEFWAVRN